MNFTLMILCIILLIVFKDDILGTYKNKLERPSEDPIAFPLEPMYKEFVRIREDIEDCYDDVSLRSADVSVMIFKSCYPDAVAFIKDLVDELSEKMNQMKSDIL